MTRHASEGTVTRRASEGIPSPGHRANFSTLGAKKVGRGCRGHIDPALFCLMTSPGPAIRGPLSLAWHLSPGFSLAYISFMKSSSRCRQRHISASSQGATSRIGRPGTVVGRFDRLAPKLLRHVLQQADFLPRAVAAAARADKVEKRLALLRRQHGFFRQQLLDDELLHFALAFEDFPLFDDDGLMVWLGSGEEVN